MQFSDFALAPNLVRALDDLSHHTPTPIQAQSLPFALAGDDLLLSAQTGSGKTGAFVLPILHAFAELPYNPHREIGALILAPTRELAQQIFGQIQSYSKHLRGVYATTLIGGVPYGAQIRMLKKGVQIIVATPGRLLDHINSGRIDLSKLQFLVMDEADRMLDMGFADDIDAIVARAPDTRQTIMSSATWDGDVGKIARRYTQDPKSVSIEVQSAHIEESAYYFDNETHKQALLLEFIGNAHDKQAIIFSATKQGCERLAQFLTEHGAKARYLHGDLPQSKRSRVLADIKSGKCQFLVATDVAARGIDIPALGLVINYDLPMKLEDYVHRIGRSGRAGLSGMAINLVHANEHGILMRLNRYLGRQMQICTIQGLEPKILPKERDDKKRKSNFNKRAPKSAYAKRDNKPFEKGGYQNSGYQNKNSDGHRHKGGGHGGARQAGFGKTAHTHSNAGHLNGERPSDGRFGDKRRAENRHQENHQENRYERKSYTSEREFGERHAPRRAKNGRDGQRYLSDKNAHQDGNQSPKPFKSTQNAQGRPLGKAARDAFDRAQRFSKRSR